MSKAEVERIWLPFVPWILLSCALLPEGWRRRGLVLQLAVALAVQPVVRPAGVATGPPALRVEERELAGDAGEPGAVVVDHPGLERDASGGRSDEPEGARLLGEVGERRGLDEPVGA